MTNTQKLQWHPAFCSALELELIDNKKDLHYYREFNLSSKPLQMDMLVIEKHEKVVIKNEIGHIFRKHNIFEYKGPGDQLNIDTLFKVLAYACLYKSLGKTVNDVSAKEITVTLVRWAKPNELFSVLREDGYSVEKAYEGIYYIKGIIDLPVQIVVIREVLGELHKSLKMLSYDLTIQEARRFVKAFGKLSEQGDKNNVDAVLQVGATANKLVFDEIRSDKDMCEALRELMKDDLEQAEAKGIVIGEAKGIVIGENKGRITSIIDFVLDGTISLETGAEKAKMTVEAFKSLLEEYKATGKIVLN